LTKRETEILSLVKNGLSNNQIANDLGLSRRTVENILSCVYNKTGIKSRLELERL
jgi:DNA-binding NarL/FixJ family response regulator